MESVAGPSSQKRRHTLAHARWGPVLASLFQEASLAQIFEKVIGSLLALSGKMLVTETSK